MNFEYNYYEDEDIQYDRKSDEEEDYNDDYEDDFNEGEEEQHYDDDTSDHDNQNFENQEEELHHEYNSDYEEQTDRINENVDLTNNTTTSTVPNITHTYDPIQTPSPAPKQPQSEQQQPSIADKRQNNNIVPKRLAAKFGRPDSTLVLEYLDTSSQKLRHRKIFIPTEDLQLSKEHESAKNTIQTALEELADGIAYRIHQKHYQCFGDRKKIKTQLRKLVHTLVVKANAQTARPTKTGPVVIPSPKREVPPKTTTTTTATPTTTSPTKAPPTYESASDKPMTNTTLQSVAPSSTTATASSDKRNTFRDNIESHDEVEEDQDLDEILDELSEDEGDYKKYESYKAEEKTEDMHTKDLNKLTDYELRLEKAKMDELFNKNKLRPGDEGFVYDKRVDFHPTEESGWDSSDDDE